MGEPAKLAFVSADGPDARDAARRLAALYGDVSHHEADVVVALGGDGFLLQTVRETMSTGKPVYGMNRGTIGFLMNEYREDNLPRRIAAAAPETIRPLAMEAVCEDGATQSALAINEVALWRQSYQTAKIRISVDDKVRLDALSCDGVMVATPAGSGIATGPETSRTSAPSRASAAAMAWPCLPEERLAM